MNKSKRELKKKAREEKRFQERINYYDEKYTLEGIEEFMRDIESYPIAYKQCQIVVQRKRDKGELTPKDIEILKNTEEQKKIEEEIITVEQGEFEELAKPVIECIAGNYPENVNMTEIYKFTNYNKEALDTILTELEKQNRIMLIPHKIKTAGKPPRVYRIS